MKRHRGRFQAQGRALEESEPWSQDEPLILEKGKDLLDALENKLESKDRALRKDAFRICHLFIEYLKETGGYDTNITGKPLKKSFTVRGQERVDLEIQAGIAFKT